MKKCMFIFIMTMVMGSVAHGLSDDFEDGVIDTSKWVVGGSKGGVGGPGSGGGQWYNQEVVAADGYLQARATTPLSANTYGADGWTMTKYNFNDGKEWVMTFKWEAEIQSSTEFPTWPGATTPWHADYHLIEITDGRTDWANGIYLHPTDQRLSGTVWLYETNGVEIGPVTWSIVINPQAKTATLYEGPNGTGSVHSTVTLDTNLPWHVRFITVVGTSAGFGTKDCRINLYNFSAVSEPTDIEKFNLCSADLVCLYNFGAAIPWIGWAAEAAAIACDIKHIRELKEEGYEKIALAKEKLLAINFTLVLLDVVGDPVHDLILGGISCIEAKIWEILKDCDDINWECIKQKWPELVDEFLIFPGPILAIIPRSPVDIRIIDSQGNVMELNTEGYTNNGLSSPGWIFKGPNHQELAIILEADDEYLFEVVGTEGGNYGLDIASVSGGEEITFEAAEIPTSPGARHVYAVDWQALSAGEEGVILNIDKNGDGFFEQMVIADNELSYDEFALQTETVVDFDPDTLNLKSKGKFVTVYIELPGDFDASEIDPLSLELNELGPPLPKPIEIGDYDSDGINDLMVKFDLQELMEVLEPGEQIIDLTGRLWDDRPIAGFDFIRVIH